MPIYEYQCGKCGHRFEHFVMSEARDEAKTCPKCNAPGAKKIISSFSSFSGSCGESGCGSSKRGFS